MPENGQIISKNSPGNVNTQRKKGKVLVPPILQCFLLHLKQASSYLARVQIKRNSTVCDSVLKCVMQQKTLPNVKCMLAAAKMFCLLQSSTQRISIVKSVQIRKNIVKEVLYFSLAFSQKKDGFFSGHNHLGI